MLYVMSVVMVDIARLQPQALVFRYALLVWTRMNVFVRLRVPILTTGVRTARHTRVNSRHRNIGEILFVGLLQPHGDWARAVVVNCHCCIAA